jgi:trimeric autotransporter adhesin
MAVYNFSALSDGQSLAFSASADRLNFDQTAIAAGDLTLTTEGSGVRVTVKSGPQAGKDVLLTGFTLEQIAATNFSFADGSFARVGDNSIGIAGDAGNNGLSGGAGRDLLMGLGGNDNLQAGDGSDSVVGGTGNDTVSGNNGNDWLNGSAGNDTLNGGGGQDAFILGDVGSANADLLADFSTGWDNVQLDAAAMTQLGAAGRFAVGDARFRAGTAAQDADDRIIYNSATNQILYDADGNGAGAAQLIGTVGAGRTVTATDFWVFGEAGGGGNGVLLNGTSGPDTLSGGPGNDTINGFDGDDVLLGVGGVDSISGGNGNDLLDAGPYRDPETGTPVNDADSLDGGMGDDTYLVRPGAVILADAGGTDWVHATGTDWTLGAGLENLRLGAHPDVDSASGTGNELDNIIDSSGIEHGGTLHGLGGNDTLYAAQRGGVVFGDDGDDLIDARGSTGVAEMFGGSGNDTMVAGGQMTGGAGADSFTFLSPSAGVIHDFTSTVDEIHLDATAMSALGASGNFAAGDARFFAGTAAHDADDRVIFDAGTGRLWYDADGNGIDVEQMLVANVTGNVVATDIAVDNGDTVVNGTSGNDTLTGTSGNDTINGFAGHDSIDGGLGNDSLIGGDGNDTLIGIDPGGLGDQVSDTLDGGLGDDVYFVREDDVILADAGGIDTVRALNSNWTLAADLENLDLDDSVGSGFDGTGNAQNNVIRSASEGGTLSGLGGDDLLIARHAQNTVTLLGGDGNDTLDGSGWSTNMNGGAGDDVLVGGGGLGSNMTGGAGADSFVFTSAGSISFISDFASGTDKLRFDGTTFTEIGASGNFTANDPRFHAGVTAHDADDRIIFDATNGRVIYDADGNGSGFGLIIAEVTGNVVATDIAVDNGSSGGGQVINGTSGNDSLLGGPDNDTINGFGGNDTIDGAGGIDSMVGGIGDDLYFVDETDDIIVEAQNGGIDEVRSTAHYTLSDFVNNLTLLEMHSVGTGNDIDNVITGNSGAEILIGRGGNDTLIGGGVASGEASDQFSGGEGNDSMVGGDGGDSFTLIDAMTTSYGQDTIIGGSHREDFGDSLFVDPFDRATSGVVVDLAAGTVTGGQVGGSASLSGVDSVIEATRFGDRLIGHEGMNWLQGGEGNDTLQGGGGGDFLVGGSGADHYVFTQLSDPFNFDGIAGFETGVDKIHLDAAVMTQLGASGNLSAGDARFFAGSAAHDADDRLIFDGAMLWYDPDGTGSAAQQVIVDIQPGTLVATDIVVDNGSSGGGGQTLNGTAGNDSLVGGAGNDTINGNAGNDTLRGNAGDDSLDGGSGTDLLDGGTGNDIYVVSAGDTVTDAGGIDQIYSPVSWALGAGFENIELVGTASGLTVSGNFMSNTIIGNSAANTIRARDGNDTITGGGGNDFFDFTTAPSAGNADTITDFTSADQLRFEDGAHAGIGATGTWGASDARFWASAAGTAHDATDRVIYNTNTGQLYYDADGSGAGAAQLVAILQGAPTLSATDITVI